MIKKKKKKKSFNIVMGRRGHRLTQKEHLLNRWVTTYPVQLRPKLLLGHYRGVQHWWNQKTFDPTKAQSGEEKLLQISLRSI